jgi:hypothetical protein
VKDGVDLSSGLASRAMIGCSHGVDYTNVDPNKPGDRMELGSEIGPVPRNFLTCGHLIPVDSAGGHRYWGPAKPCEWWAQSQDCGPAYGSVTRSQPTLEFGITSGN